MFRKKGVSLSMNVIIIALLVLVVLIVLIFTYSRESGKFNIFLEDCESKGGVCIEKGKCSSSPALFKCDSGKDCCIDTS